MSGRKKGRGPKFQLLSDNPDALRVFGPDGKQTTVGELRERVTAPLTLDERDRLAVLKKEVDEGMATFVKVGNDPRYKTIRMGWEQRNFPSFGHVFIDSQFEGGADYDSISFDGARRARYEFSVTWTLVLKAAPGARVTIRDKTGALVVDEALCIGVLGICRIVETAVVYVRAERVEPEYVDHARWAFGV